METIKVELTADEWRLVRFALLAYTDWRADSIYDKIASQCKVPVIN